MSRLPIQVQLQQPGQRELAEQEPSRRRAVRIVVMSDTHNEHGPTYLQVPYGDILVHCGDFTDKREWYKLEKGQVPASVGAFNEFLGSLPHPHKIVISGNHELGFNDLRRNEIRELLSNAIYLEDQSAVVEGIRFYGTPWTSSSKMAFSARRSKLERKWQKIPDDTDILITHLPPYGVLDLAWRGSPPQDAKIEPCSLCNETHKNYSHWGSNSLLRRVVEEVKPKVHLFGHVHDTPGSKVINEVTFINAATHLRRECYFFDYYLPK